MKNTKEELKQNILDYFYIFFKEEDIKDEDRMSNFDIDNFDLVELELHIEDLYNFYGDGANLSEDETLEEIVDKLFTYLHL